MNSSSDGQVVSLSAFAYIYSELVQYHQGRAASISELERRLESAGYGVGLKVLEMTAYRAKEVWCMTFYASYICRILHVQPNIYIDIHIWTYSPLRIFL